MDTSDARSTPAADEFYIGYEGGMPSGIRRAVRAAVLLAAAVAFVVAGLATTGQRPLANAVFEYGQPRPFEGWLTWTPAPALLVREGESWRRFWLVAPGKFGAARALAQRDEGWMRLAGAQILREGWQMLEVVPGSAGSILGTGSPPVPAPEFTQPFHGRGEIVDSKCYLGVMNPGERIVHRDCAIRCLSGGIPAMFAYRDAEGGAHLALLLQADGRPIGVEWTRRAGSPIDVSGTLHVSGDVEVLVIGS